MFDWLVAAINTAIGEDKDCAASVGVLDIYGFESFEYNDLEQARGVAVFWWWWLSAAAKHGGHVWNRVEFVDARSAVGVLCMRG